MIRRTSNFGLSGEYSNFLGIGKKAREKREARKEERQNKKEDRQLRQEQRKDARQEKRELANEKRKLKNDLRQAKVEEKTTQTSTLSQQLNAPSPSPEAKGNEGMIVAAVLGLMLLAGVGWFVIRKQNPGPVVMPQRIKIR